MKIFVYSTHRFEKPFLLKAANNNHELIFSAFALETNTAKLANGCKAIIAFTSDDLSAGVLDELYYHGIRFIALRSVGFDHVDLLKARQLGSKVANVPDYSPCSVEHAVALLMALNRKLLLGQKLMKRNDFSLHELIGLIRKDVQQYIKTDAIASIGSDGLVGDKVLIISLGNSSNDIALFTAKLNDKNNILSQMLSADLVKFTSKINNDENVLSKLINNPKLGKSVDSTLINLEK